jgi:hypothetical protein
MEATEADTGSVTDEITAPPSFAMACAARISEPILAAVTLTGPSSAPIAGHDLRVGKGSVDVAASRSGDRYRTEVDAKVKHLRIGHTVPRDADVRSVTLDGKRVRWDERTTNRGLEVTVEAGRGDHTVVVEAR